MNFLLPPLPHYASVGTRLQFKGYEHTDNRAFVEQVTPKFGVFRVRPCSHMHCVESAERAGTWGGRPTSSEDYCSNNKERLDLSNRARKSFSHEKFPAAT